MEDRVDRNRQPGEKTVDLFRLVDRLLGVPLCFALTVARWFREAIAPPNPKPAASPRHVLVLKLSETGSLVLASPMLDRIRAEWPGCRVSFLTFEENREAVSVVCEAPLENVFAIDPRGVARFLWTTIAALLGVRRSAVDTTIDLEFFSRFSAAFAFSTGARTRVGFHRYHAEGLYRGNLLTHRVLYNAYIHTAAAFLSLARAIRPDAPEEPLLKESIADSSRLLRPRLRPSPLPAASVPEKLAENVKDRNGGAPDLGGKRIFILNPNASGLIPIRRWPLDRYVALAKHLLQDPANVVVLIGKGEDRIDAAKVEQALGDPRCINMADRTSLSELLALFSFAAAMVTNDSGPAHFASFTEMPTVALFGPETPLLYGPLGSRKRSLWAGFACSPCVSAFNHRKTACTRARCLEAIDVADVLQALAGLGVPVPLAASGPEPH